MLILIKNTFVFLQGIDKIQMGENHINRLNHRTKKDLKNLL